MRHYKTTAAAAACAALNAAALAVQHPSWLHITLTALSDVLLCLLGYVAADHQPSDVPIRLPSRLPLIMLLVLTWGTVSGCCYFHARISSPVAGELTPSNQEVSVRAWTLFDSGQILQKAAARAASAGSNRSPSSISLTGLDQSSTSSNLVPLAGAVLKALGATMAP